MRILSRSWAAIGLIACLPAVAGVNSWTVSGPEGGNTTAIAFHPTQPNIVLAQTWGGLYRSTDGGTTWSMPVPNKVGGVGSIVFDPTHPDDVFFGSEFVYGSTDAGLTFNKLTTPSTRYVNDIAVASDGTLYLADQSGYVFRSDNHGANWADITGSWGGSQTARVPELIVDPNEPKRVYAAVSGTGLFRSEDRGATWNAPTSNPPLNPYIYSLAVQPNNSDRLLIATDQGFYLSTDRGVTWALKATGSFQTYTFVAFDPGAPTNAIAVSSTGKVQRSSDSGVTWASNPADLKVEFANGGAFTPGVAGRLFLGTTEGPMLSTDGGATFAPRYSGIHASVVAGFASTKDGTLYSLQESGPAGVFRREGDSWLPLGNENLRASIRPQPSDIATAPSDASLIYVITLDNELVRSVDGGASWSMPAQEFTTNGAYPQHVIVDPADANVAYVATRWSGLWKTIDRGVTWARVDKAVVDKALKGRLDAIGVDPTDARIVYAVCSDNSNGALLGIFKSNDGGQTWDQTDPPRPGQILGFTFDPTNTQTIYAYSGSDVLKTTDGGDHWVQMNFGSANGVYVPAMTVLIDPVIPSTMFVVSMPNMGGFMRSVDSGATWETFPFSVPQGEFLFLQKAVLDPQQPSRIHVGVHGLGIAEYEVAPDFEITLQGLESAVTVMGSRAAHVRVRNLSSFAASPSEVKVTLPDFLTPSVPTGCSLNGSVLACKLPALLAQGTQTIEFSVTASGTPASGSVRAEIKGHETDSVVTNNEVVLTTSSVPASSSSGASAGGGSGGGGGGGRFDWLTTVFLALLLTARRLNCVRFRCFSY